MEKIYSSKEKLDQKNRKSIWRLAGVRTKETKNSYCLYWKFLFLILVSKLLMEVSACKRIYSLRFGDFLSLSSAFKCLSHC